MIPRLEDIPLGKRIMLTVIVLVVLLIALALFGFFSGRWEEAEGAEQIYQGVPLDAHLLQIDKRALEDAYRDHLKLLFSVWLKDDISTTQRINNGLRVARRAYGHAAEQIDQRERALQNK